MRSQKIFLLLIVIFFVVGWSLGVVLPPDPWRTWLIVIVVQTGLVWYSQSLSGLISDGAQGVQLAIRRRWLVVGIDLATFLLLVGYTCCKDGRWVGVVTNDQENMMGATCVIEMVLGFSSFIYVDSTENPDGTLKTEQPASINQQDIEMGGTATLEAETSPDVIQGAVVSKTG